jgi:hypothetical protein
MKIEVVDTTGVVREVHYKKDGREPDKFGRTEGYRVQPPGSNKAKDGFYISNVADLAVVLTLNKDYGTYFKNDGGGGNLFYNKITIDGKLR